MQASIGNGITKTNAVGIIRQNVERRFGKLREFSIGNAVKRIQQLNPSFVRREQLFKMFKKGNKLLASDGRIFSVCEADCGQAILMDSDDDVLLVSWVSPNGEINTKVAKDWKLFHVAT